MGRDLITVKRKSIELNAKPFSADDVLTSLGETLEYTNGDTNLILTGPDLIQARIDIPDEKLWNWYTAFSELDTGKTDMGIEVAVVSHGDIILNSPERIRQALDEGLTNTYAAKLKEKEFKDLLKGILPNGKETVLVHIDDLEREAKNLPKNYSIILDKDIMKLDYRHQEIEGLREHPLFIAFCGNAERASKYLDMASKKYNTEKYGCWNTFKHTDFDLPQGRFLCLSYHGDYGSFSGDYNLDNSGLFMGVAPEAQDAFESELVTSIHEDIIKFTKDLDVDARKELMKEIIDLI